MLADSVVAELEAGRRHWRRPRARDFDEDATPAQEGMMLDAIP